MHRGVTTGRPVFKGSPFPDTLAIFQTREKQITQTTLALSYLKNSFVVYVGLHQEVSVKTCAKEKLGNVHNIFELALIKFCFLKMIRGRTLFNLFDTTVSSTTHLVVFHFPKDIWNKKNKCQCLRGIIELLLVFLEKLRTPWITFRDFLTFSSKVRILK